jgi:hypothetical protein
MPLEREFAPVMSNAAQLNERQIPIPKSYFGADGIVEE